MVRSQKELNDLEAKYSHIREAWEQWKVVEFLHKDTGEWVVWHLSSDLNLDYSLSADWRVSPEPPPPEPLRLEVEEDDGVNEVWEKFWRPLVYTESGELDLEQIKKELFDFHFLIENMPKFIEHATGGACSNPMVHLSVLESLHDDYVTTLVDEAYEEAIIKLRG